MISRKRMFYDIEVSYFIGSFWRLGWKERIMPHQIISYPKIICISWKWEGEEEVHNLDWGIDKQCDKKLVKKFIKALDSSDEIVAHNGDRFDIKWIRTRAIDMGIEMNHTYKSIDTLKLAKSSFNFHSNRLDELAKFLKVGQKIPTDYTLWDKVIQHKDKDALDEMNKYCNMDVTVLEKVYEKLRPYTKHKTHYAALTTDEHWACPECGSTNVQLRKIWTTAAGVKRFGMQHRVPECGTNYTISGKKYSDYIVWKMKNK